MARIWWGGCCRRVGPRLRQDLRRCRRPSTSRDATWPCRVWLPTLSCPGLALHGQWHRVALRSAQGCEVSLRMVTVFMCLLLLEHMELGSRLTRSIFECVILPSLQICRGRRQRALSALQPRPWASCRGGPDRGCTLRPATSSSINYHLFQGTMKVRTATARTRRHWCRY